MAKDAKSGARVERTCIVSLVIGFAVREHRDVDSELSRFAAPSASTGRQACFAGLIKPADLLQLADVGKCSVHRKCFVQGEAQRNSCAFVDRMSA